MRFTRNKRNRRSGFTYVELLIVVAIILVLGMIGAAAFVGTERSMEQAKLDRIAENLYNAAQNRMSMRAARGSAANEALRSTDTVAVVPSDMEQDGQDYLERTNGRHALHYVISSSAAPGAADALFPEGSISEEVRGGSWIVEFEPDSYSVYSVFYSETADLGAYYEGGSGAELDALRGTPEERGAASHNQVGYYSGSITYLSERKTGELDCVLELLNREKLTAAVTVRLPSGEGWKSLDFVGEKLYLSLKVTGVVSGKSRELKNSLEKTMIDGTPVEFAVTLDGLGGENFRLQFCEDNDLWAGENLIPGEDIVVEAIASCGNEKITLYADSDRASANSLFEDGSDASAVYVAYGRHLQNLDRETSGFAPAAPVEAWQTKDVSFTKGSAWSAAYGASAEKRWNFTPITNSGIDKYYGGGKSIRALTVSGVGGSAGLFAEFGGSLLNGVTLIDATVKGTDAAGGLAGRTTGSLTVSGCRLYMQDTLSGEETTARTVDWMSASAGAAGGLIGRSTGTLRIESSFAATVVRGGSFAGGLVGEADGGLAVTGSYADCYLSARRVGGLAGLCAAGGSFASCYSAGFVMNGDAVAEAAGFTPSAASVSDSYTIFCFDDATVAEKTGGKVEPLSAPDTMTRYALVQGGAISNAFYTYSRVEKTAAKQIVPKRLEVLELPGFETGEKTANVYQLTAPELAPSAFYPYPTLPTMPHYNDSLVVEAKPVNLYRFILTGTEEEPKYEDESVSPGYPYSTTRMSDGRVKAAPVSRVVRNQAFVGWFDEEHLPKSGSALAEWYGKLDALDVVDGRLADVPKELGALEDDGQSVKVSDNVAETGKLYAVYREIKPFDVVVEFMNFNSDKFHDDNTVTAEKYMGAGSFSIRERLVFTVSPFVYPDYKTLTMTYALRDEIVNGYSIVDSDYPLDEAYPGVHLADGIVPVACFDKRLDVLDSTLADGKDAYDVETKKLIVRLDQQRTYVVLCNASLIDVPIRFEFRNSLAAEGTKDTFTIKEFPSFQARIAALSGILENVDYDRKGNIYTATVWMRFPPNAIIWSELPEFAGFRPLQKEITNPKITAESVDNPPNIPYERIPYKLSFNLNGGVYQESETAEPRSGYDSISDMYYMEPVSPYLPARAKLSYPGHKLTGWKFFELETYGPKASPLAELTLEEMDAGIEYNMPHGNVMAEAQWEEVQNPPVRVEIYIQNATDQTEWNVSDTEENLKKRTYSFYNSYTVEPRNDTNKLEEYKKLKGDGAYLDLLKNAYTDMRGNKTMSASPAVEITADTREYLRSAYDGTIDGTVQNRQFRFNSYQSEAGEDGIACHMDASGTAVFKLFFDREIITFEFKEASATYERLKKEHRDPGGDGYGGSFAMNEVTWNERSGCCYYDNKPVYVLRDDAIDDFVADFDGARDNIIKRDGFILKHYEVNTNFGDYFTRADRQQDKDSLITIDGKTYLFGRFVMVRDYYSWLGYNEYACFIPFYDSGDLDESRAADYRWTIGGLVKGAGVERYSGLYEQVFLNWPGNGEYNWAVRNVLTGESYSYYTYYGNEYEDYATYLSYLGSFFYDGWISARGYDDAELSEESLNAHELLFEGKKSNGTRPVYFYLEKAGSGLDGKLRALMDNAGANHSKTGIDAAVNGWVASEAASLFDSGDDYRFCYLGSGGSFILNDKFLGYTVKGYSRDDRAFVPVPSLPRTTETYSDHLNIYNLRNWNYVFFENISNAPQEAYFYQTTLDRLPDVKGNEALYRPANIGNEYSFQGWYTQNGGGGYRLVVGSVSGDVFTEAASNGGKWLNGTVYQCIPDETVAGKIRYEPYVMPASNAKIFALWATDTVSVDFYSRLPVAPGSTAPAETPVTYADAHLFEVIPNDVFQRIEGEWNLIAEPDGTLVYKLSDELRFSFDGWYRYSKDGAPGYDERLNSRFHEQEFVTTPNRLTLAAQWTQLSGEAYYNIICYLLDENDGFDPNRYVELKGEKYGFKAKIGEPLNVQAPSTSIDDRLSTYYPTSPLYSTASFEKGRDVVFFYRPASTWDYYVLCNVTYQDVDGGAAQEVAMRTMEEAKKRTASVNVIVEPEEIAGYVLAGGEGHKSIVRTDAEEDRFASYSYTLDASSISQPANVNWIAGEAAPKLLTVTNGTGNRLACATDGYEIRTYYSVDGGEKTLSLPAIKRGSHTVAVTLELWKTGADASRVLTIHRGVTTVKVYTRVSIAGFDTLYYDGAAFYQKTDAGMTSVPLSALVDQAKAHAISIGKTFKGFYLNVMDAEPVIDENGYMKGKITGDENEVTLTPKYE